MISRNTAEGLFLRCAHRGALSPDEPYWFNRKYYYIQRFDNGATGLYGVRVETYDKAAMCGHERHVYKLIAVWQPDGKITFPDGGRTL